MRRATYGDAERRLLTEKNANGRKRPPALTAARGVFANFAQTSGLDRHKVRARARPPPLPPTKEMQPIDCDRGLAPFSQHWLARQQALKHPPKYKLKIVKGIPSPTATSTTPNLHPPGKMPSKKPDNKKSPKKSPDPKKSPSRGGGRAKGQPAAKKSKHEEVSRTEDIDEVSGDESVARNLLGAPGAPGMCRPHGCRPVTHATPVDAGVLRDMTKLSCREEKYLIRATQVRLERASFISKAIEHSACYSKFDAAERVSVCMSRQCCTFPPHAVGRLAEVIVVSKPYGKHWVDDRKSFIREAFAKTRSSLDTTLRRALGLPIYVAVRNELGSDESIIHPPQRTHLCTPVFHTDRRAIEDGSGGTITIPEGTIPALIKMAGQRCAPSLPPSTCLQHCFFMMHSFFPMSTHRSDLWARYMAIHLRQGNFGCSEAGAQDPD